MFRKPKQDKEAVAQLLDLEFESRRSFINADLLKERDKAAKITDAYPCFKDIDHVSFYLIIVFWFSLAIIIYINSTKSLDFV